MGQFIGAKGLFTKDQSKLDPIAKAFQEMRNKETTKPEEVKPEEKKLLDEGLKFKGRPRSVKPKGTDQYRTMHYAGQQHLMKRTNTGWVKVKDAPKDTSKHLHKSNKQLGKLFGIDIH